MFFFTRKSFIDRRRDFNIDRNVRNITTENEVEGHLSTGKAYKFSFTDRVF